MGFYNAIFASLVLILAFASVLWGLRIFKIFLVILGIWTGFGLGMFLGELFETSGSLFIWGLSGAIICAGLAWPLQKMFVFSGVGLLLGFLVFAVIMSRGGEPESGLIAGATVFFIAGFFAVLIYDYFVIILMAMVSAYTIVNICFLPQEFKGMFELFITGNDGIIKLLGEFGGYYSELIWPALITLSIMMLYSIYLQKVLPERKYKIEETGKTEKTLIKKLTFICALVVIIYALADNLFGLGSSLFAREDWIRLGDSLRSLSPGQAISYFGHNPILNISPISFPLAAYISFKFIKLCKSSKFRRIFDGNRWIGGWIIGFVLGIVILPIVDSGVLFLVLKMDNFEFAGNMWLGYFKAFISAPLPIIILKWLYSLALFPMIIAVIVPTETIRIEEKSLEPQVNYCI